ncbi:hypothetical protein FQR65_LT08490 [Abscondita terminalis]|nr:hypothetical protein FQR65_LT08490 [Abscondita terminalis]
MKLFLIVCFVGCIRTTLSAVLPDAGCAILVNEHLSDPQPLLVLQNDATTDIEAIVLPDDDVGTINFNRGETIDVACPGTVVVISNVATTTNVVSIACSSGINFNVNGKIVPFTEITCKRTPSSVAQYTGKTCATKHKEIEIGFQLQDRFIRHITTCFNVELQHAIYSQDYLISNIGGSQVNYPRPDFQVGKFYNVKPDNVDSLYSRKGQTKTINKILGLDEADTSVIHPTSNVYLATGHYTPKAEYIFGLQQRLTFYYVNAAPQWQSFNGANWNTMEANCRKLAGDRQTDFIVYTGTYGIATLPDVNGNEQELYLWVSATGQKAGIVLLGFNNPHKTYTDSDKIAKTCAIE